ncbi:MAG: nucleotidyltransferase domain-containing protein [candidate division KSB1 bacterium]|nr:nucleotidyltransferase domain-containing protein [candidate division KSB1 bacterium]
MKRKNIDEQERNRILSELKTVLQNERPISFACLYGSFNEGNQFNDIDLAIYVNEAHFPDKDTIFQYQLSLGAKADLALRKYEVDLRILNLAPLTFRFNVVNHGALLFYRDWSKVVQFVTRTRDLYFDFRPYIDFFYQKIVLEQ